MDIIETLVLGLTQGLTEFIPISSSGHLIIVQTIFSGSSNHLFLEFINIGTLLALLVYFRKRIFYICKDVFIKRDIVLARNIFLTAIPAGVVGYLLADIIGSLSFFSSITVVAVTLALVGIVMIFLEKIPKLSPIKGSGALPASRAFIIGLAQILSLVPGVSRSGSTIITGRLMGLKPADAAEYSFLASLPIMIGVTAKVFISATDRAYFFDNLSVLLLSNTVAFVSGILAVGFIMKYLSSHSLAVFGWYRVVLSAILTTILLIQYL